MSHTPYFYTTTPVEFEKETGIKVNVVRDDFGVAHDKLVAQLASGASTYDVCYTWAAWLAEMERYFIPLKDLGIEPSADSKSDMLSPSIEAAALGAPGKEVFYGLPKCNYTFLLHCNRKMFKDAGMKYPTTYQEFFEAAKFFTKGDVYGYTDGWGQGYILPKYIAWLHANGGLLNDKDGNITFNSEQGIAALQDMVDLYKGGFMPKASVEWVFDNEAKKVFLGGKAAMELDYGHLFRQAFLPELSTLNGEVDVVIFPGKPPVRSGSQSVGEGYVIPKTTQKKELAVQFLQYLSGKKNQMGLLATNPKDEDPLPAYKSMIDAPEYQNKPEIGPLLKTTKEQMSPEYHWTRYPRPLYQKINDIIEAEIAQALRSQKTAKEALDTAAQSCTPVVDEERKKYPGYNYH